MPEAQMDFSDLETKKEFVRRHLEDREWRLRNLYMICDVEGKEIRFTPNWSQQDIMPKLHNRTAILKARQLGFTTLLNILWLDSCLFRRNTAAGIVAHRREDADAFFINRIQFAYNRLPSWLKKMIPAVKNESGWLILANGSSIRVSTGLRSGTVQLLHISEMGKICAQYPQKARELATGSLNAVHSSGYIIVESTAEGSTGYFHQWCQDGIANLRLTRALLPLEWKTLFYPWFKEPRYTIPAATAGQVDIPEHMKKYFVDLNKDFGVHLTQGQKAWYCLKLNETEMARDDNDGGSWDDMKREFPSTPEEAFASSVQGAYYAPQFVDIDKNGRIGQVPIRTGIPVDSWWDLGYSDQTSIWFTQTVGRAIHVVAFYSSNGKPLSHYRDWIDSKRREDKWTMGRWVAPHDVAQHNLATGKSLWQTAADLGMPFEVCPRLPINEGIDAVRRLLPMCWFNVDTCSEGITSLRAYAKKWDAATASYSDTPKHDRNSHGADAFRTLAVAHEFDWLGSSVGGNVVSQNSWA